MKQRMRRPLQAAALRYDAEKEHAPRVVASGEGLLARRIIERAKHHGVPVLEDAALAAELVQLGAGEHIPSRVYLAVAKVLAFVYSLDKKSSREPQRPASGSQ